MSGLGFSNFTDVKEKENYEDQKKNLKNKINDVLKDYFRPEFLNRIDEIIVFNPLRLEDIEKIVNIQTGKILERLGKQNIHLTIESSAKKWLAINGYDSQFGARPLKRLIQKSILDPLADKIIKGEFENITNVEISEKNKELVFNIKQNKKK